MSFVADPPPPDADARREFKYPYLACEIFCCELDAVFATLCEDECALFGRIVSFIDTDEPLHPTRAGYFGKVVGCVVARRAPETTRFFQNNPHVLRLLVRRIENLAVAEVLLRLVGADDPGISPMQGMLMSAIHGADNTGWLAETTLLDQLLDALGEAPETSDADGLFNSADTAQRRANAAEVLVGIARGAPSALADRLATADAMRELFAKGLERVSSNESAAMYGSRLDGSSGANDVDEASTTPPLPATAHSGAAASPLVNVVDVAVAVLDAKRAAGPAQAMQAFLAAETGEAPPEPRRAPPAAVAACARALEDALATSEAQCEEDFRLIDALATPVAMTCDRDLLESLATDETSAAVEALARALVSDGDANEEGEGEGEDGDDDLRRAYERARGKMAARVAALTEAHAANRADRIKLLTNLVTASRMESWQNQSSLPNRE